MGGKFGKASSQQQNALGYNLSMQGIGDAAIDGPRFEEFLRSRKGGLARILLLGCTAGLIFKLGAASGARGAGL